MSVPEIKEPLSRSFTLDRSQVDEKNRTVELSFSSEEEVRQWFGIEILDHSPGSVRLDRLRNSGTILVNHNTDDVVGVPEKVWLGPDRKGRAVVRFGRSDRAEEVFRDVVDGIRRTISVSYQVHKMITEEENRDGLDRYRVTDWEPNEISFVSVPADTSVGVGRSEKYEPTDKRRNSMSDYQKRENKGRENEKERIQEIHALANPSMNRGIPSVALEHTTNQAIEEDWTVDQFRNWILNSIPPQVHLDIGSGPPIPTVLPRARRNRSWMNSWRDGPAGPIHPDVGRLPNPGAPMIGMGSREVDQYSFLRIIRAMAFGHKNPKLYDEAGFEFEVSEDLARKFDRDPRGVFIPPEVWRRDLNVGIAAQGGDLVATDLMSNMFIEILSNRLMVKLLGATILDGLVGNVAIPRQTGEGTVQWLAEGGTLTESMQAADQVLLTPTTIGAMTDLTRRFILQSSLSAEQFVRNDLMRIIAKEIDRVAINGSGTSNEPEGILNTTGIGSVAIGTNGGAPTWAHIVSLESEVAGDNADIGSLAYLTNTKVRGKLKQTDKGTDSGQFVWEEPAGSDPGVGRLNGYRAGASNQVPSNLTKGTGSNLSAAIFGNFSDLVIGHWGILDITADPFTLGDSGGVRIRAFQDLDVAVRHPASFAAVVDMDTT